LLRHDLDPAEDFKEVRFSTTPNEIVQAILNNHADVGIIRSDMYDSMKVGGEIHPDEIRVLHENDESHTDIPFDHSTAVFPERVFAKLRRTSDELTERVTVALLKMPSEGFAAEAARCSGWTIPHNYQPIHDVLKKLRISPYDQFGKVTLGNVFFQYRPWITSIFFLVAAIIACFGFTLVQTRRLNRAKRMILEQQIVETSDRTQRTLGGIIHDTLGQQLTAIRLLAETLREQSDEQGGRFTRSICSILDLAREATRHTRQIAVNLYPVALSQQGLGSAVESYLSAMKSIFGIQYETRFPKNFSPANPEFSLHLYRIIQEAVHNAIKHGQAKHVQVVLEESADSYVLYIEDDGTGFDPDDMSHTGLGLHIMKYRADDIRGELTITRGRAGGIRVTCTFDLKKGMCRNDSAKRISDSGQRS
jgi:signal transduction histidine kinase